MKAATLSRLLRPSSMAMYSGKVSKLQSIPELSASIDIPSTFSRVRTMMSRCSGWVGATPKPQFPMITLVTPCQLDGVRSPSHRIWAS